jgi:hypothetical protein
MASDGEGSPSVAVVFRCLFLNALLVYRNTIFISCALQPLL